MTKQEIYDWLEKQSHGVLATISSDGSPTGALVGFSQTENLEFVFFTDESSRKAQNMARDNRVSFTVSNETDRYTLQLEGRAEQLTAEGFAPFREHHYQKQPFARALEGTPGRVAFLITPTHLKFTDITVKPWAITELTFSQDAG